MSDTQGRSSRQQTAILIVTLLAIWLVVALLCWIAFHAMTTKLTGISGTGYLLLVIIDNQTVPQIIKLFLAVFTLGASYIAGSKVRDWIFWLALAVTGAGVLISIGLLYFLPTAELADEVFNNAKNAALATSEGYSKAIYLFFGPVASWLAGMMLLQLGFELPGSLQWLRGNTGSPPPSPAPPAPALQGGQ